MLSHYIDAIRNTFNLPKSSLWYTRDTGTEGYLFRYIWSSQTRAFGVVEVFINQTMTWPATIFYVSDSSNSTK